MPLDVIRGDLVPSGAFPFRTTTGGPLGFRRLSGLRLRKAVERQRPRRIARAAARGHAPEGRLYGIGLTAVVEPGVWIMGYVTTVLTPEERPARPGLGTAHSDRDDFCSIPAGRSAGGLRISPAGAGPPDGGVAGRRRCLGLKPSDIRVVTDMDTARDAWSIASGNYASRFGPAVCGAVQLAAERIREKLGRAAAGQLNVPADEIEFRKAACARKAIPTTRCRSGASPPPRTGRPARSRTTIRRSARPCSGRRRNSPRRPRKTASTRRSATASSSILRLEVDRMTGAVRIDKYVTMHDCGRVLHPGMVAGQVTGGFAHALGAALYEEYVYADDGNFISGTLADYLMPTTTEVPAPLILHFESPSPFTPLGAKGVGEGNCMSTPVCIANAVADALGVAEIDLPLTPGQARGADRRGGMKPAPFDYVRAASLAEAHDVLAAEGSDARRDRGRADAGAAALDAHGAAEGGGRHHACRRSSAASQSRTTRSASARPCGRPNCWRGQNSRRASRC